MGICYIVGAGDCEKLDINKTDSDLLIAADAGYKYVTKNGFTPDIVIGDFDSLGSMPNEDNVIKLNPVKDVTDMYAAVQEGIKRGFSEFVLFGATGGRLDHTIANLQLIASLSQQGFKASICNGKQVITAITDFEIQFDAEKEGFISVFSHTEKSEGVNICGLKYSLENAVLTNSFPLGVSNEFIGKKSSISVTDGTLVIIYNK